MKRIPLYRGRKDHRRVVGFAIVDGRHFDWLKQFEWYQRWDPEAHTYYAIINRDQPGIRRGARMHRLIMAASANEIVDHHDGNGLKNLEDNLRKCTNAQNVQNQRIRSNNRSGFKGVYWDSKLNCWRTQIGWKGKNHYLGNYQSKRQAGLAYNVAAQILFGEFARLNTGV